MKPKYHAHVNVSPEMHNGQLAHYWKIDLKTEDGIFTIRDGFHADLGCAIGQLGRSAQQLERELKEK